MRLSGTKTGAANQYRGLGDQLWDLGGARPTLDLNFAQSKSLVDATTGSNLVDHTRASSGTYVGSDGLIKTAVTNLLLQSEDFSTTWTTSGTCSVSIDQAVAPDGKLTAEEITVNSGLTNYIGQSISIVSGTTYTLSVYVKAGTISSIALRSAIAGSDGYIVYAFATDSISIATPALISSANSISLGNGWYRLSMQYTPTVSGTASIRIGGGNTNNGTFYLWGAQLEQSSTVGEYVKTTSTINSAPRFDHDPTTGESLGLLVEESRTNLLLRSEEFDQSPWSEARASIENSTELAPDGSSYFKKLTEDTSPNLSHFLSASIPISTGAPFVFSFYVKAGERLGARVRIADNVSYLEDIVFNASTGVIVNGSNSSDIEPISNDVYRVWIACVSNAAATSAIPSIEIWNFDEGSQVYDGDGTSGIYLWGAQLEEGSFPTSYIPTTSSTVTRAADVASISGSNYSGWINLNNGTLFNDSKVITPDVQTKTVWSLTGGTYVTSLRQPQGSGDKFRAQIGNTFTPSPGTGDTLSSGVTKACVAYSGTAGRLQVGISSDEVTAGGILDATNFFIGSLAGGTFLNGTIRRLTYWPQRLPDSTLQTITQ